MKNFIEKTKLFEKKILAELLDVPMGHVKYVSGYPIQPDGYANTYKIKEKYYEIVFPSSFDETLMEVNDVTAITAPSQKKTRRNEKKYD